MMIYIEKIVNYSGLKNTNCERMRRICGVLIISVLIINGIGCPTKPKIIYLDQELKEAMYFDFVQVQGYTDSTIIFQEIDNHDGYFSKDWLGTQNFKMKAQNDATSLSALISKRMNSSLGFEKYTTGYFPEIKENILIVISKENRVTLFAKLEEDKYRFWSPSFTGSSALFCFKSPATKLEKGNSLTATIEGYETCFGGCLLPAENILVYSSSQVYKEFYGNPKSTTDNPVFFGEFSYSEPYFLYGEKKWEERYINKKVVVRGILFQFVEGKSTILDWEIVRTE